MATNLRLGPNDRVPYDETVQGELDENEGMMRDDPVLALLNRPDDQTEQFLRGLQDEADRDRAQIAAKRETEMQTQFAAQEPGADPRDLQRSAARIAAMEEPIDYIDIVHPEWDHAAAGKTYNPNAQDSWVDAAMNSKWGQWIQSAGKAVAGGVTDVLHSVDQAITPETIGKMVAPEAPPKAAGFDTAYAMVEKNEGGFVAKDGSSGGGAIYGINQRWHPEAFNEAKRLTDTEGEAAGKEYAKQFYKREFWDKYGVGDLPEAAQTVVMDGVVNHRSKFASELVAKAKAGASADDLIEMRRGEYERLAKANPERYGASLPGWTARLENLKAPVVAQAGASGLAQGVVSVLGAIDKATQVADKGALGEGVVSVLGAIDKATQFGNKEDVVKAAGRVVVGGAGDMLSGVLEGADKLAQAAGVSTPEGGEPTLLGQAAEAVKPPDPKDTAEKIGRGLVQFASFFFPGRAAMMGIGASAKMAATATSALGAFAIHKPDDETLSTFITSVAPGLKDTPVLGPILQFLKSDPNDGEMLRRTKFVIEDLVMGGMIEIGSNPKATIQSLTNSFDAVRQSIGGKVPTSILADETGALWYGVEKNASTVAARQGAQEELQSLAPEAAESLPSSVSVRPTPGPEPIAPGAKPGASVPTAEAGAETAAPLPTPGAREPRPAPIAPTAPTAPTAPATAATAREAEIQARVEVPLPPPDSPTPFQRPQPLPTPGSRVTPFTLDEKLSSLSFDYAAEIERFRRGDVRHIADVANEAKNLGITMEDVEAMVPGEARSDTVVAALGQMRVDAAERARQAAIAHTANPSLYTGDVFHQAYKDFGLIDSRLMGAGREAGRVVRWYQEADVKANALVRTTQETLAEVQATGRMDIAAKMLASFTEPEQAASFLNQVSAASQKTKRPVLDSMLEWYANALTSKPTTFVKNLTSNFVFLEGLIAERGVAGLIDIPVQMFAGHNGKGVGLGEMREMFHGQFMLKKKTLSMMSAAWREDPTYTEQLGNSVYTVTHSERPKAITAVNYGLDPDGALGKLVNFAGRQVRLPSRIMNVADAAAWSMAEETQLHALAYRKAREVSTVARQSGSTRKEAADLAGQTYQSIIAEPPKHIREATEAFGAMATFRDKPGAVASAMLAFVDKIPVLRFPFTFIATPSRAISQGMQRVPVIGLANRDAWETIRRGTLAEREILAAKQAVGMGLAGVVWYMASHGRITPSASRNKTLREAQRASQIPSGAIGVGDDGTGRPKTWYSLSNLIEPYATAITAISDLVGATPYLLDDVRDNKNLLPASAAEAVERVGAMYNGLVAQKSSLTGMNNLIDTMMDPSGEKFGRMLADIASGFIPNIAQGVDDELYGYIREAKSAMDRFQRNVPIWNEGMKVRRDPITGNFAAKESVFRVPDASDPLHGMLALIADITNPVIPGMPGHDPDTERIYEAIWRDKLSGIGLHPQDSIETVKLEPDELDRLEVLRTGIRLTEQGILSNGGKTLKEKLLEHVNSTRYAESAPGPQSGREIIIRQAFDAYDKVAQAELLRERPELAAKVAAKRIERVVKRTPGAASPAGQRAADEAKARANRILIPR